MLQQLRINRPERERTIQRGSRITGRKKGLALRAQITIAAPAANRAVPAALSGAVETAGARNHVSGTAHHRRFDT